MSEFVLWTPLFSFVIFILFFAIGDWISNLTDSKVSGLLIAMLLYLVGFQTGVIPASSIDDTGLTALASNFAIMLINSVPLKPSGSAISPGRYPTLSMILS